MALEIIGMFGTITGGTQDAIAQVDVPQDGVLRGLDWDLNPIPLITTQVNVELSFIATNQLLANDVRGRISSVGLNCVVLTAVGVNTTTVQKWIGSIELMLSGGERLYLHSVTSAGVAGSLRCNIHFDGGATVTRRSARR